MDQEIEIPFATIKEYLAHRLEWAQAKFNASKKRDDMLRLQGSVQILLELQNLPAAIIAMERAEAKAKQQILSQRPPWRGYDNEQS